MSNLNAVIEISALCKSRNIDVNIDTSGIVLSTLKNGDTLRKRYDLDTLSKIVTDLPLEILIDVFIEETVLTC